MDKIGVLSLVWDEDMDPSIVLVHGVSSEELHAVVQQMYDDSYNEGDEYHDLSPSNLPKLLKARGYQVVNPMLVGYSIWDGVDLVQGGVQSAEDID